ncbi:hypothetical protein D3C72_2445740 [compost metagenome]
MSLGKLRSRSAEGIGVFTTSLAGFDFEATGGRFFTAAVFFAGAVLFADVVFFGVLAVGFSCTDSACAVAG